jgi:hypothetical protein
MPRYFRKIITITAEDSPNVQLGLRQKAAGLAPTHEMVVPGVLPYDEYCKRRLLWDEIRQSIGLDAKFWEGKEDLLYPPSWLDRAARVAEELPRVRRARAIGIDPAEGGDMTSMSAVDEYGLIEQQNKKTPDTNVVPAEVIAFGVKHGAPPERWVFDRGGGGKQHADRLRAMGYPVQAIGFGEGISLPIRGMRATPKQRRALREERYTYKNRRAQLYGFIRELLDPSDSLDAPIWQKMLQQGFRPLVSFGIPQRFTALRQQMSPIPLMYDGEGRMRMLAKRKRMPTSTEKTLLELIGHSPDELDSLACAVFGMVVRPVGIVAGAAV